MKRIFGLLLPLIVMQVANAQQSYTIKGAFSNKAKEGKVFCTHMLGDQYETDSAVVKKGKFTLSGKIDDATMGYLSFRPEPTAGVTAPKGRMDRTEIFMEPASMKLSSADSLKYAKVDGSPSNDVYLKLKEAQKPVNKKMESLNAEYGVAYKNKDKEKMKQLEDQMEAIDKNENGAIYKTFINDYPTSPVALYALTQMAGYDIDVPLVEPAWNNMNASLKNSASGVKFAAKLDIARKTQPGKPAMDFIQNNVDGVAVKLSDFRGKYVLVDFWASWCGPCRAENPNVVANYNKYKDKNFTVLGVSLDGEGQKDRWVKAIKDDHLDWTQVSDLKGWQNEVAVQYGIQAIPKNLLVGPDGIIIATSLREEALSEALKKIFGE